MWTVLFFGLMYLCSGVYGSFSDDIVKITQQCCNQGKAYARNLIFEDCSSSNPPDVPAFFSPLCIFAMDDCCKEHFRSSETNPAVEQAPSYPEEKSNEISVPPDTTINLDVFDLKPETMPTPNKGPYQVYIDVGKEIPTIKGKKIENGAVVVDTKDLQKNEWTVVDARPSYCHPGFEVDEYGACADVNECATNSHNCIPGSQRCENTVGSFLCIRYVSCGIGYILNASTGQCEDIDECALGTHNCGFAGNGYHCENQPGSFLCVRTRPHSTSTTAAPLEYEYEYYDSDKVIEGNTTTSITSHNKTNPEVSTTITTAPTVVIPPAKITENQDTPHIDTRNYKVTYTVTLPPEHITSKQNQTQAVTSEDNTQVITIPVINHSETETTSMNPRPGAKEFKEIEENTTKSFISHNNTNPEVSTTTTTAPNNESSSSTQGNKPTEVIPPAKITEKQDTPHTGTINSQLTYTVALPPEHITSKQNQTQAVTSEDNTQVITIPVINHSETETTSIDPNSTSTASPGVTSSSTSKNVTKEIEENTTKSFISHNNTNLEVSTTTTTAPNNESSSSIQGNKPTEVIPPAKITEKQDTPHVGTINSQLTYTVTLPPEHITSTQNLTQTVTSEDNTQVITIPVINHSETETTSIDPNSTSTASPGVTSSSTSKNVTSSEPNPAVEQAPSNPDEKSTEISVPVDTTLNLYKFDLKPETIPTPDKGPSLVHLSIHIKDPQKHEWTVVDARPSNCQPGFEVDEYGACADIDECLQNKHLCSRLTESCRNMMGGYKCVCAIGFSRDLVSGACEIATTSSTTTSTTTAAPVVSGYDDFYFWGLLYFDPVTSQPFRPGTLCDVGYHLNSKSGKCEAYLPPKPSTVKPTTEGSRSVITCPVGYKLGYDNTCEDIDECVTEQANCGDMLCTNLPGGYVCSCPQGYKLTENHQCEDIDECELGGDIPICPQNADCINTKGSYRCKCHDGFRSAPVNDTVCVDVDECRESSQGSLCQHRCNNVWGGYQCSCHPGYRLNPDNRTCTDVNECEEFNSKILCVGRCVNDPGSYHCICPRGYRLSEDKRGCIDIDECETGEATCARNETYGDTSNVCLNTRGGYRCHNIKCPPGYKLKSGQRCIRIKKMCQLGDWECVHQPISYSYNFITFVSKLYIPASKVYLFQMPGPSWVNVKTRFQLKLINVNAPPNVEQADISSFVLVHTGNQAVMSLVKSLEGPQSIELELSMDVYKGTQFAGTAVSGLFIYVSEYEF